MPSVLVETLQSRARRLHHRSESRTRSPRRCRCGDGILAGLAPRRRRRRRRDPGPGPKGDKRRPSPVHRSRSRISESYCSAGTAGTGSSKASCVSRRSAGSSKGGFPPARDGRRRHASPSSPDDQRGGPCQSGLDAVRSSGSLAVHALPATRKIVNVVGFTVAEWPRRPRSTVRRQAIERGI
jgi:hypothetical protein